MSICAQGSLHVLLQKRMFRIHRRHPDLRPRPRRARSWMRHSGCSVAVAAGRLRYSSAATCACPAANSAGEAREHRAPFGELRFPAEPRAATSPPAAAVSSAASAVNFIVARLHLRERDRRSRRVRLRPGTAAAAAHRAARPATRARRGALGLVVDDDAPAVFEFVHAIELAAQRERADGEAALVLERGHAEVVAARFALHLEPGAREAREARFLHFGKAPGERRRPLAPRARHRRLRRAREQRIECVGADRVQRGLGLQFGPGAARAPGAPGCRAPAHRARHAALPAIRPTGGAARTRGTAQADWSVITALPPRRRDGGPPPQAAVATASSMVSMRRRGVDQIAVARIRGQRQLRLRQPAQQRARQQLALALGLRMRQHHLAARPSASRA